MLRSSLSWFVCALALAAASSGCRLHSLFDLDRAVEIDETRSLSVDLLFQLDLAEGGKVGVAAAKSPSEIALDSADVTISQVDTSSGVNDVRALGGTLSLRPTGAVNAAGDVLLGTIAGLELRKGATARIAGAPESGALLLEAHKSGGRFQLVCNLSLAGGRAAHLVLFISLHVAAGYDQGV